MKVVFLLQPNRPFDGSAGIRRPPRAGDIGAIVHDYGSKGSIGPFVVEMVNQDGLTVWLADFEADELELVSRP